MQILIDGRSLTPNISGIGRYIFELVKGYVSQYGEDSVLTIVNKPVSYFPYPTVECPYQRHSFPDNIKFSQWLSRQQYDIFHSGDMTGPFWHKHGRMHIVTCHDLMYFIVPGFFKLNPLKAFLRKIRIKAFFGLVLKDADMVVSISQTTHADLKRIYGVDSIVLREGINKIDADKETTEFLGLKKNSFFFYVGLGAPHKNIDFMVRAFLASNTEKQLVICGKGHKIINSDRIIYPGYVEDSDLDFLYRNCAAFIFPSKYEGFGLPILEALSYHCRVFSSNAGSLGEFSPEVIHFFNPDDENELIALIENTDEIKVDVKKIDQYLNNYNWNLIWKEFHKEILAPRLSELQIK